MMGPQQTRGPEGCVVLGENVSRPQKTAIPHGGYGIARHGAARSSPYEPCSLYEELTANKSAADNGGATLQEFTRLSPSSLARYQMYLARAEDSASSVEEVVRTRSGRTLRMRPTRCRLQERPRKKRHVLQSMARPLKKWLIRHRDKPYPSKAEKLALALGSHMTLEQVSNWFANARRRLKNTVYVPGMNWGDRIRHYNNFISGNTEPLSISSDDSIWDSESEQRDVDGADENSTRAGATQERCLNARVELFEHSYSSPARHKDEAVDDRPAAAAAVAASTRVASKRALFSDGESQGGKRARPSCDSDGPSEDSEDDSDDTTSFGCSDGARQLPPPLRRPLAAPAPAATPSAGSKRRLPDSKEFSPPCKKYKTRMLLRYIGADLQGTNGDPAPATDARKQLPVSRPTAKRPREEKTPGTNGPKKVVREGQRQTAKKRKCGSETFSGSGLRWTEIEAAEALTHLSQSSALCWQQQQQHQHQQRVA